MLPVLTVSPDLDGRLEGQGEGEFEENIFLMAACSFQFCPPGIFWCSYRGDLCEVTRKEVFDVSEELCAHNVGRHAAP